MIKIIKWKDIKEKNIRPIYQISNTGLVRNKITGIIRKQYYDKDGYLNVTLEKEVKNTKNHTKRFRVNRLVAKAFLKKVLSFKTVNHMNGKKDDNRSKNLEWATNKQQYEHAVATGLREKLSTRLGEDSNLSIYTEQLVRYICQLIMQGDTIKDISIKVGSKKIDDSMYHLVGDIKRRTRWNHISKDYDF